MKFLLFILTLFILSVSQSSFAKSTTNAQQLKDAQDSFERYRGRYQNNSGLEGRIVLEEVHSLGLEKTAANVRSTRELLSTTSKSDERVILTRIMGSLYTPDNKTGMNNEIKQDLKRLIYTDQKDVARAGTFAYSRLGYSQDTKEVLLHAKNNGFIDSDEYFGEIAHVVPYAPASDQSNLVYIITKENNRYALEILAFHTQNSEVIEKINSDSKRIILSSLEANEPGFSPNENLFSYVDAIRYSTWLHSIASLNDAIGKTKYEDTVLAHLNDRNSDPRKIMAFLISPEGTALFKKIGKNGSFDYALDQVEEFYKRIPPNPTIHEVIRSIAGMVNSI